MKRGSAGPSRRAHCGGMSGDQRKVRHRTLGDAKRFRAWFMDKTGEEYVRIYKCPVCKGGFHLTTQEEVRPNSTVWRHPAVS